MSAALVVAHIDPFALGGVALVLLAWSLAAVLLAGWCYARGVRRLRVCTRCLRSGKVVKAA